VPPGTTVTGRRPDGSKATVTLEMAATAAHWPTPLSHDQNLGGTVERGMDTRRSNLVDRVTLAAWGTPTADEAGGTPEQMRARKMAACENGYHLGVDSLALNLQAQMAAWTTPNKRDYRTPAMESFADRGGGKKGENLNHQVIHQGPALTGSSAEIASGARLNPALSRWLMRIPPIWDQCGAVAFRASKGKS